MRSEFEQAQQDLCMDILWKSRQSEVRSLTSPLQQGELRSVCKRLAPSCHKRWGEQRLLEGHKIWKRKTRLETPDEFIQWYLTNKPHSLDAIQNIHAPGTKVYNLLIENTSPNWQEEFKKWLSEGSNLKDLEFDLLALEFIHLPQGWKDANEVPAQDNSRELNRLLREGQGRSLTRDEFFNYSSWIHDSWMLDNWKYKIEDSAFTALKSFSKASFAERATIAVDAYMTTKWSGANQEDIDQTRSLALEAISAYIKTIDRTALFLYEGEEKEDMEEFVDMFSSFADMSIDQKVKDIDVATTTISAFQQERLVTQWLGSQKASLLLDLAKLPGLQEKPDGSPDRIELVRAWDAFLMQHFNILIALLERQDERNDQDIHEIMVLRTTHTQKQQYETGIHVMNVLRGLSNRL